jgi:hypothetical protein
MLSRMVYLACAIILWVASPALVLGQSPRDACKDARSQQEWDSGRSPVYADATKLARILSDQGFAVDCIRRSKEERLFKGQKGATWYRTDQGVFEVWFLPKTESFGGLEIIEQPQANGRYIYTFRGTPRILTHIDSSKQMFFLKRGNLLFEVWGNKQLATSLDYAFQKP